MKGLTRYIFNREHATPLSGLELMPITDVAKKQLAQKHRLHYKVCRNCGARNPGPSIRCRKCRGYNLRWKKRELGAK